MRKVSMFAAAFVLTGAMVFAGAEGEKGKGYPQKGITLICPWTAGGGTDTVLRALGDALSKQVGVTVTVENRTGGGGAIGHRAIKDAKPDGYTIGMITWELSEYKEQGVADFTYADFDPLCRVNMDAAALTVKADAPYNTVQEFVDYCKDNPGKVSIGNSAPLSVWHVGAALLAKETGIDVKHVPFEGAAPAVTALAGGHIQAVSVSLAEVKSQLDAGNVKCIGVMDSARSPMYPNIPTFQDQGFNIVYGTWRGMALPKGVNPEIKAALVQAFKTAAEDPAFTAQAQKLNLKIAYLGPDEFNQFLKDNLAEVTTTLRETHLLEE